MKKINSVQVWEEQVIIPTYEAKEADKNPMFLEKRVYQGSSGKVYPHPVTEAISNEKINKTYHAVFIENQYLKIMILPELGGRIQRALDKTNGYDFVYYNHVIKPALVGLAGPWISGGIEFNWPQHHRPSTFDPVDYRIEEHADGSATVWVSEIEKMYHTKGMAGFTLYPDKAYLEIKGQLYNPTDHTQTFLWWANPAVAVNDNTQSIFPPDVHAVMDHGKRDVSAFPIATGTYYKVDYSAGVDISRYKNIPVPTSYMAYHSDYDFIGNYDYGKQAGLLHIADHHVSPGKKQWTWGNGDFGQAWDRNLTDEDGPYIELMTGMYTDNQPDFSFLEPYEEKTFVQYFMPYKDVGAVKNATIDAMVNLELNDTAVTVTVYCTSIQEHATIELTGSNTVYLKDTASISPYSSYSATVEIENEDTLDTLSVSVKDKNGALLVSYQPISSEEHAIPDPAKPSLLPEEIETTEELFLTAVHLEQYRHATYRPEDYYLEGLRRDPTDIRLNNGYGKLLYKKGLFKESIPYFNQAIKKLKWKNPNPYDGEPLYNLGLSLRKLSHGKFSAAAFDAFYKAIWNGAVQDSAYYQLACLSSMKDNPTEALDFLEKSLIRNSHNLKARTLKTALLRRTGKETEAVSFASETGKIDCLDFGALYETALLTNTDDAWTAFKKTMREEPHNYIELSLNYANAGLYEEALSILERLNSCSDPILHYYAAYNQAHLGIENTAELKKAAACDSRYCFPNRLEDIEVLEYAIKQNTKDAKAPYYLGNLLYDKGQHEKAVSYWETSCMLDSSFPTVYRNLSLAYFNKHNDSEKAYTALSHAFALDCSDARVFLELDQLRKRMNLPVTDRLTEFDKHIELIQQRDDLYTEYVTLLNLTGQYECALSMIEQHIFHPWEGGEGKIPAQYKTAHIELAKKLIADTQYTDAAAHLCAAMQYPHNLGEGKLIGCKENDIHYLLGLCYEKAGDTETAHQYYRTALVGDDTLGSAMYYNDQPPELFFYQALAAKKLGEFRHAQDKFEKLIQYYDMHKDDKIKIDYFAVSLPDFLIFESDLDEKNYIHCNYLKALGCIGIEALDEARTCFEEGLRLDQAHQGLCTHYKLFETYRTVLL